MPGRGTHELNSVLLARRAFAGNHVGVLGSGTGSGGSGSGSATAAHPLLPAAAAVVAEKRYDAVLRRRVESAARVTSLHAVTLASGGGEAVLLPFLREDFSAAVATKLEIFRNPLRGAYRGLIGELVLFTLVLLFVRILLTIF